MLEYYSGILILTTNRVGEFDEAFKSRIHMSLYYPKLDRESTIKIWEMNLMRIRRDDINIDVEDDKIMKFAKAQWSESKSKLTRRWNGRQIKNAFQIAIALAKWDFNDDKNSGKTDLKRPKLSEKQFKVVSQTSAHFDDYISNVHGIEEDDTYATLAERETLRKDSVMNATALRGRDSFGAPSTSKSSKRIASKYDASDDEDEVDGVDGSDEDDDQKIRELELKLELEKMKGRKKSVTKERMISPKTRDQPSRRSKQRADDSSDHSDRSMSL